MSETKTSEKTVTVTVMVVKNDGSSTIKRLACSSTSKRSSRLRKKPSKALSKAVFG